MPSRMQPGDGHGCRGKRIEKGENTVTLDRGDRKGPMRQTSSVLFFFITVAMVLGSYGCATIRTMPTMSSYGSPKVFSGVRLDYNAATENMAALGKFKAEAPSYPLVDLPFSAILDTLILPATFPVAAYEFVFE